MPTVEFNLGGTLRFLVEEDIAALVTLNYGNFTITARGDKMAYTLPIDYAVKAHVSYVDRAGNPAVVDGDVAWASSDESIVTVQVDASDSSNVTIGAMSKIGQAQVSATADADLGTGTREIITLMDVSVVAGEAVAGTISPVGDAIPPHIEPQRA
jgi:hypothetical protein